MRPAEPLLARQLTGFRVAPALSQEWGGSPRDGPSSFSSTQCILTHSLCHKRFVRKDDRLTGCDMPLSQPGRPDGNTQG